MEQEAETQQQTDSPSRKGNWADMVDEGDEDQELTQDPKPVQKKQKPQEEKKKFDPPAPRQKTDRGDYVITSFSIPDRVIDHKKVLPS